jgi:hypothetical protein
MLRSGESEDKMSRKFDHFELIISLEGPYEQNDEVVPQIYLITQSILINGENLSPDNPIDLRQLAKSCQLSGEFYIVTCGCGSAGCAGIDAGIRVNHFVNSITWDVPDPIITRQLTEEESKQQPSVGSVRRYTFEPSAYLAAVQTGLREAKRMLFGEQQPVECSPYGFGPEDLINLDPIIFSERGAPLGLPFTHKYNHPEPSMPSKNPWHISCRLV